MRSQCKMVRRRWAIVRTVLSANLRRRERTQGQPAVRRRTHCELDSLCRDRLLDLRIRRRVDRGRRLVEDDDPGVLAERPGERQKAPLADREVGAVLIDDRDEAKLFRLALVLG
jgi:hypothetical protein